VSTKETVVSTTSHTEAVQARLQELRQMRELIPRLVIPASAKERSRLNGVASVPTAFVELTTVSLANEQSLVRGAAATPAEIRDLMAYAIAYAPFADELEAFAQFVRYSVTYARNQAASEALTAYALAQRLAKRPEGAHLAPHVADMRRALGRVRRLSAEERQRRAEAKEAQTAAPES